MDSISLLALMVAASVNAVVPGPGMLLALGRSAARGMGAGIQVSLGIALATLMLIAVVWAVMAGALILSERGLAVLRLIGIGVLVVLSLMLLFGPGAEAVATPGLRAGQMARGRLGDLGGGLATGLTSPVHLVFLLALVPQFVDFAVTPTLHLALVTLAIVLITTIPMLGVSVLGARSVRWGFGWARRVTRMSGVALLGLAVVSATSGM
jgi:threonine/homoserine/homoserine lactone efflux protein